MLTTILIYIYTFIYIYDNKMTTYIYHGINKSLDLRKYVHIFAIYIEL